MTLDNNMNSHEEIKTLVTDSYVVNIKVSIYLHILKLFFNHLGQYLQTGFGAYKYKNIIYVTMLS